MTFRASIPYLKCFPIIQIKKHKNIFLRATYLSQSKQAIVLTEKEKLTIFIVNKNDNEEKITTF